MGMSIHVHGVICTREGIASNNRGENEGNSSTLQKLVYRGKLHSTVSSEAIRFALRRWLALHAPAIDPKVAVNRTWDEESRSNAWKDAGFDPQKYADDDLLGFMNADAARAEAEGEGGEEAEPRKKGKKVAKVRRSRLEVARAISLTPWAGDTFFGVASPEATPSAQKKGSAPVPFSVEVHATRYQYGFSLTPEDLCQRARAALALRGLAELSRVAGNHARFLYDFSPESVVLRVSHDPAPRILYCFEQAGRAVEVPRLVEAVESGDLPVKEIVLGGAIARTEGGKSLAAAGAIAFPGVLGAVEEVGRRLQGGSRKAEAVS
jgi:CRISPR-associated protein Cst2